MVIKQQLSDFITKNMLGAWYSALERQNQPIPRAANNVLERRRVAYQERVSRDLSELSPTANKTKLYHLIGEINKTRFFPGSHEWREMVYAINNEFKLVREQARNYDLKSKWRANSRVGTSSLKEDKIKFYKDLLRHLMNGYIPRGFPKDLYDDMYWLERMNDRQKQEYIEQKLNQCYRM